MTKQAQCPLFLSLNKMIFINTLIRLINWASVNKIIIVIEGAMKKTKRASCLLLSSYVAKEGSDDRFKICKRWTP